MAHLAFVLHKNSYCLLLPIIFLIELSALIIANMFADLSSELFTICLVFLLFFYTAAIIMLRFSKIQMFSLFLKFNSILNLLLLFMTIQDIVIDKDVFLLLGYWLHFLNFSPPGKEIDSIFMRLASLLNALLLVALLIFLQGSIYCIVISCLIVLIDPSLKTIGKQIDQSPLSIKSQKSVKGKEPWKNIFKAMFSGMVFLLKILPNEENDCNEYEKLNCPTQETKTLPNIEKGYELILVNDKARDMNLICLQDCLSFALKEFEVLKIVKQENFSYRQSSNCMPNLNLEDIIIENFNDKKVLPDFNCEVIDEQKTISFSIHTFLKTCLSRVHENNQPKKFSVLIGDDTLCSNSKLVCSGRLIEKNLNYDLTITEFFDRSFNQADGNYILFEFAEKRNEGVNQNEFYSFKDQILANVAHDLRSPINGILSFIDLSMAAKDEKERRKNLEYAKISGNLLLSLVSDILDFSVIKDGKLSIQIKPFSLKELIDEVVNLLRFQAEVKQLQIKVENNLDPLTILQSDRRRLSQLLINLLTNSIKFTNKGSIRLLVSKTCYRNLIKFEIKDTGIGIKTEILPYLFRPFATFDTEKGLNKYGIGLGLNICQMIAGLLGPCDSLHVSSLYHHGSKFGFLLFTNIKEKTHGSGKLQDDSYKSKVVFEEYTSYGIVNHQKRNLGRIKTMDPKKHPQTEKKASKLNFRRKTNSEIQLNVPNESPSSKYEFLKLQKFKSNEDTIGNLPLDQKVNPSDFFCAFNQVSSLSFIGDEVRELSFQSHKSRKRTLSCEIPSHIEQGFNSNSSINDIDEFDPCESPLKLVFSKRIPSKKFISSKSVNSDRYNKPFKKKMISTQEIRLSFQNQQADKKLKILIADDNAFNHLILSEYLKKLKVPQVCTLKAYDGSKAMEIFEAMNKPDSTNPLDMILMDCQMPILDGYETSKAIRNLIENDKYQSVFIIAITAFHDENKCLNSGMNSFLLKPVGEKDFLDAIQIWMNI